MNYFTGTIICGLLVMCWANQAGAQSKQIQATRANALHGTNRDGIPYEGQNKYAGAGMILNIVEGRVSESHPEFTGRVANDALLNDEHATQVASTAASAGIRPETRGPAFEAQIRSYDWNVNRVVYELEPLFLVNRRPKEYLITNHSYEFDSEFASAISFGSYDLASSSVDSLTSKYPYWLPVAAAGNRGKKPNNAPHTSVVLEDLKLDRLQAGMQTAKNALVVGNISSFSISAAGGLAAARISPTSSLGPTDDLRVKPDVYAPGEDIEVATLNRGYTRSSGTSFACPAVAGTALILQQYYFSKFKRYMRAATMKALLLHTADRIPTPAGYVRSDLYGPDPYGGWGLVNARVGQKTIRDTWLSQGLIPKSIIYESALDQSLNRENRMNIPTKAGQTVRVSLCWMDPQHSPEMKVNSTKLMIVHDLEVMVLEFKKNGSSGDVFYPYSFYKGPDGNIYSQSGKTNSVDTYEFIRFVPKPECTYQVVVFNQGVTLRGGRQQFSLVITGLGKDEDEPQCDATTAIRIPVSANIAIAAPKSVVVQKGGRLSGQVLLRTGDCESNQASARVAASEELAIDEANESVIVFPNPTPRTCMVTCAEGIKRVLVFTEMGDAVGTYEGNNSTEKQVDISSFRAGLYLFRIETTTGKVNTKKVIKQP